MAELEERPTKIRKLDRGIGPDSPNDSVTFGGTNGGAPESHDDDSEDDEGSMKSEGDDLQPSHDGISKGEAGQSLPMSKSQLKKLRKREEWLAGKDYRKAKRKEKLKKKKALRAEQEAEDKANIDASELKPTSPKQSYRRPVLVPITFVLDCDFDELMTEKEIISLASQLSRCYSDNRSAPYKAHLVVSSFRGQLRQRFETVLSNHHHGWKGVKFMDGDFVQASEEANIAMRGIDGGRISGALASTQELENSAPPATHGDDNTRIDSQEDSLVVTSTATQSTLAGFSPADNRTSEYENDTGSVGIETSQLVVEEIEPITAEKESSIEEQTPAIVEAILQPYLPSNFNLQPSVVYLSSDSPNTLDVLSPYTTYIVGGIVDKNRYKGICYKRACERGIPTARLPIGEYMTMQSRTVLATNHVIEIMVRWLEDGDWGKSFLRVIPKRKEAKLKLKNRGGNGAHGGEDDEGQDEGHD